MGLLTTSGKSEFARIFVGVCVAALALTPVIRGDDAAAPDATAQPSQRMARQRRRA
jgi:hypothetical protein